MTSRSRLLIAASIVTALAILALYLFSPLDSYVASRVAILTNKNISVGSLSVRWNMVSARDIVVKSADGSEFLAARGMRIGFSFVGLLKGKLDIKYIEADSMSLHLLRTREGRWIMPELRAGISSSNISVSISAIEVRNSVIFFDDRLKGAKHTLTDVQIDVKRRRPVFNPSIIKYSASAAINPSGSVNIVGQGDVARNAYNGTFMMKDVDINLIKPYMQGRSKVKRGLLSMESDVALDNGYVKAPSKIKLRNFDLEKGDVLMGAAGPLIVEMLKKDGEINISFSVWGRWNNLQNDLSEAFHKKILAETGRTITSPVESVIKGIGKLLPF